MSDTTRGKYIVFEGGEGTGKTTQSQRLADRLSATWTREPGGDQFGLRVREILLDPGMFRQNPMTDVLMFAAQRAELAESTIKPAIKSGNHVVTDRSWISSAAYQSAGEDGVDLNDIKQINQLALGGLYRPDLVLLFDAAPEVTHLRLPPERDFFESRPREYHQVVRRNFLEVGQEVGAVVINAALPIEEVAEQVNQAVNERLGL